MSVEFLYPLVSEAIRRAETLDDLQAPGAASAYLDVSLLEERIAEFLPACDPEGALARRGAVRAALAAKDLSRAQKLVGRFLAEADCGAELRDELLQLSEQAERSESASRKRNTSLEETLQRLASQIKDKTFSVVLVGRTGVGKSTMINSLLTSPLAPVGDYEPTTDKVTSYSTEVNGIELKLVDTPGLDTLPDEKKGHEYIRQISEGVSRVDSLWFLSRLDETRVTSDEKVLIRWINEAFGKAVWQNAIILFTFAGSVNECRYSEAFDTRTKLIREEITRCASPEIAERIPSVAVENTRPTTPDGQIWIKKLYIEVLSSMSRSHAAP